MRNYGDLGGCYPPNSLIIVKYLNSTSAIKISQTQTRPLRYARGVSQGCILSPLLFSLYVNDLPSAFENTLSDPFALPNGAKLNFLKQDCKIAFIDKMSSHCTKTKIMVFQKRARKIIDVVQEYTYLGTRISSSRNFCFTAHVKISKKKPFMPYLARDDIRISAN